MAQEIKALHRKYAPKDTMFELVFTHCQIVAEIALWCAANLREPISEDLLQAAALLHDIGTYGLMDKAGKAYDHRFYSQHAILGAKILADEGADPRIVSMVETHLLLGLTKQEIIEHAWALPAHDYTPRTIEAEILCYADRFHSKAPQFNSFEAFSSKLGQIMPSHVAKFEAMAQKFGKPDLTALSRKYGHPVV